MKAFIDSSFFVALTDRGDRHFKEAEDCFSSQIKEGILLLTSNFVLAETITRLRYRAGFRYAKEFGEKFRHSKIVETVWVDSHLEEEAWHLFLKYADKELSYVDCLSVANVKLSRIDYVLTFDKHFVQVGLSALP